MGFPIKGLTIVQTSEFKPSMDDDDVLRTARAEVDRLEALLREHPIYQRLEAMRRLIELYTSPGAPQPQSASTSGKKRPYGPRAGSQAQAIRKGAAQFLREKGARARSGEIYKALLLQGVLVKGQKPTAVVASYLSHSDIFDASPDGYGLTEWTAPHSQAVA